MRAKDSRFAPAKPPMFVDLETGRNDTTFARDRGRDHNGVMNGILNALDIVFLVDRFPVVTETFILNQITGLLDRGHRVHIFARRAAPPGPVQSPVHDRDLLECTTQVNIPRTRPGRLAKVLLLLPWLLARHPVVVWRIAALHVRDRATPAIDALYFARTLFRRRPHHAIVHAQFGPLGSTAAVLRDVGVLNGPLVTSFRGYDLSLYLRRFGHAAYRHLMQRGDLFLTCCDLFRTRLIQELGCDENKVHVHRSGIDVERFAALPHPDTAASPVRILTVGRLVEKKGVETAIRALARIALEHPDVTYTVIGDGPLRGPLQALVRTLGLQDRVSFLGEQTHDEVLRHLAGAALLVAPSITAASGDQEGIPNSLKEAMAAGLPVIATRHAGIPELVEDGVSGFLVPERDVEALAARICELVTHPAQRQAMGRAGQRLVQRYYDTHVLNEQLVTLYNRLLERGARS